MRYIISVFSIFILSCPHHKHRDNTLLLLFLLNNNQSNTAGHIIDNTAPIPPYCPANDMFKDVSILTGNSNTVSIKTKIWTFNSLTAFIIGWDFKLAPRFHLQLQDKNPNYRYYLTAYGIYDSSSGHECDIYFQRWGNSNLPVENFDFTNIGTLSVDGIDYSLQNPAGGFYSFTKTYVQLIAFDNNGVVVTDIDTATVKLEEY